MPIDSDFKVIPETALEWERFFAEANVNADGVGENTVGEPQLIDDTVTSDKIAAGAVTNTEIATDAVQTTNITDRNVTFAKLPEVAADRILGRLTSAGDTQELTATQVRDLLLTSTTITDAETAHNLNATYSDTEVEAALDALGAKINLILDELLKST